MGHVAAVKAAIFVSGNFVGYVWIDLYSFPLIDSAVLRVEIMASRN